MLTGLTVVFCALAAAFALRVWGKPRVLPQNPLVSPEFTTPTTFRTSYLQLIRMKADLSDYDCYGCHEKNKPPTLRFDTNQNLIIPQEHADVVMAHGTHGRNNNCYNCHNEKNLTLLQTRDVHDLKLEECPPLCGSCHGPTYRDWEAGAHGRVSGYWDKSLGETRRAICVDCHNPHKPKIPSRQPAPPPNPLRPGAADHAAHHES